MRCVAMVVRGTHVIPCDRPCTGRYCEEHVNRDNVLRDARERERAVAERIAQARKNLDPDKYPQRRRPTRKLHPRLQYIVDTMNEERFYGRAAHERTLMMLEQENRSITKDVLTHTLDGFECPALNRDMDEIILRSRGKMLATRLRMAEREKNAPKERKEPVQSRKLSLDDIRTAHNK